MSNALNQNGVHSPSPLRVLMALPGLHRVNRGAEAALESLAEHLAIRPGNRVTLIGSGPARAGRPYHFVHAPCTPRERFERWPSVPVFRGSYVYEEASFARHLRRAFRPADFDVTLACSYPFTNWTLRSKKHQGRRVPHVYVTQNGDWPAHRKGMEYQCFSCDGLVCTTPDYFNAHKDRWNCVLIPNGVDTTLYTPGPAAREKFGLPKDRRVVLMVSALIPSKRVLEGIRVVAQLPDVFLIVLGDGPLREDVDRLGAELLPGRFLRSTLSRDLMPQLYRSVDALLHMSMDEPFGNIYIEAMACGLPCVAHEWSSTRWIMEGSPWLVDTRDAASVRDGLARALAAKSADSGELAASLHATASRRFAWTRVAEQYEAFLRQVAGGSKQPTGHATASEGAFA